MNTWEILAEVRERVSEEEGNLQKQASLRVALCHPSPYAVGMSSLGYQSICREICLHPGAGAERAFLPDNSEDYRRNRLPVFTYESQSPISDFPIAAFSVSYELEITGLLEMLYLSRIPLLREDRDEKHPLVVVGGPFTNSNPLILAPFVDLIILGEGEESIHTLLDSIVAMSRDDLLDWYSGSPGCYVPGRTPVLPKLLQVSDARLPARSVIFTKNTVLSSMFLIEPERGCSHGCTYCVMRRTGNRGMRVVAADKVLSLIPDQARRVGLVGAAVGDHPKINDLIRKIVASGREIAVSSLRADRLDEELARQLALGGHRTLTTASDGASQRLRKLIDRNTTEEHLIGAAELVRKARLLRLKLYQIIGLPGETDADIDELVRFSIELSRISPLSLSISPFVAKRNTPMDGALFEPIRSLETKVSRIRSRLRGKVEVRPTSARWAWVEYMLSQGGETAGLAAMDAWQAGGSFASWKRAFVRREVKPFRGRPLDEGFVGEDDEIQQRSSGEPPPLVLTVK